MAQSQGADAVPSVPQTILDDLIWKELVQTGGNELMLRSTLEKIADPRKRSHREPDAYTQLGCVMQMAQDALDQNPASPIAETLMKAIAALENVVKETKYGPLLTDGTIQRCRDAMTELRKFTR